MRRIVFVLIVSALCACVRSNTIGVMSFNVRQDNPADSMNSWVHRSQAVGEMINGANPDIIGTQEVLNNQFDDLKSELPLYDAAGVGRLDGDTAGEYCAIFYKRDRFDQLRGGTFWLSPTPEQPGSKGWDAACERIATWVMLKDKKSGKEVFFINTHLDHVGKVARSESVKMLLNYIHHYAKKSPVILTGDFNCTPQSETIQDLLSGKTLFNSSQRADSVGIIGWSFHNFGRMPENERPMIDYIFVNKSFKVRSFEVLPIENGSVYYSDHAAIVAELAF